MKPETRSAAVLGREGAVLHSSSLGLFQRLVDLVVIIGAGLLATRVLGYESLLPLLFSFLFAAVFVVVGEANGLYHSWRAQSVGEELGAILVVASLGLALAVAVAWPLSLLVPGLGAPLAKHGFWGSLLATGLWLALVMLVLLAYRVGVRALLRVVRVAGLNQKPVLLVGSDEHCRLLAGRMEAVSWYGFRVVGSHDTASLANTAFRADLVARAHGGEFDQLFVIGGADRTVMAALLADLADAPVATYIVPDIFFNELTHPRMYSIAGVPAVGITTSPLLGASGWLKRVEDLVLGSLILALVALPMLVIAVAVKATSPGPALFRQVRYGLDGRPITVYKFRTMRVCEDGDQVTQAQRGDQRVTRLGAFLRRTSLDELPQFINVLEGKMSIVGPRPHARAHNEYYRRLIPNYMLRHKIKPGITGWAQVNGWRGETDELYKMEKRVEFDIHYIRNWSVLLDLQIIIRTVFHVLFTKEAY